MKLDVAVNEAVLSNVGTTGEFRIRNSAKAFKILSDGLYSNKIRAIIRELSCNAVDSHVAAGKQDVPFEVHLPTMLEPYFGVKDFGLGLSGEQVMNIYTTYFESSKTDSNDFIGALGLGSKSPFSYTENFTVTAIKDGMKRIYSAFINEMGVPCVAEMGEEITEEVNGVEVKFSVTERYDYRTFANEAQEVFSWFANKPKITGVSLEIRDVNYKEKNIVPGVHVLGNSNECYAIMGNIPYPLRGFPEAEKHLGDLHNLLNSGLVLEFGIGELDFAASREQLSYVPLTINSIKRKLELLNDNLEKHLAVKANAITDEWARAVYLYEQATSRLFGAAVKQYVTNTKFALFDAKSYHGQKNFELAIGDLTKRQLDIKGVRVQSGSGSRDRTSRIKENSEYSNGVYVKTVSIPVNPQVVIVLNDLKTGCLSRARYHYLQDNTKTVYVYCVSYTGSDEKAREAEYAALIKELHNPPTVVRASTLLKPPRSATIQRSGLMVVGTRARERSGHSDSYLWNHFTGEVDEDETYYYVCLDGNKTIDKDGKDVSFFATRCPREIPSTLK